MMLLLDLGNSRLKWALTAEQSAAWAASGSMSWTGDPLLQLREAWAQCPPVTLVMAASVVDVAREAKVGAAVQARFGISPHWVRTPASACGIRNAYAEPGRLGVDRFLAMVAAHVGGWGPCVLASAGTALTVDALAADGRHLGGLIAPGAQLMQDALPAAAARIRPERPGVIVDVASNTADAVTSGCWHALAALVERFAMRMRKPLGCTPTILVAGGDAEQLLSLLTLPAQLFSDSVLRGLAHWAVTECGRLPKQTMVTSAMRDG
ncbi:MAG: type III pantothenate kinase [Rhodanobacter sp.]